MIELNADESRVLGVLIEKATTTPDQYPLSLNATLSGANQKNNRDPVLSLTEDQVFDAVESLRAKGLLIRVDMAGSRVHRYRHQAGDVLRCRAGEIAVLAELLLRGPQTLGELRGRASRMHPMETLDVTRAMLDALMNREEPLVRQLAPLPGSRAERYAQLLSPDSHPAEPAAISHDPPPSSQQAAPGGLAGRVERLEAETAVLRAALSKLAASLGEADPFAEPREAE